MTVRYWVLVSNDLLYGDLDMMLPAGLRLVTPPVPPAEAVPGPYGSAGPEPFQGTHWQLFEDDTAPPELAGCRVELTFRRGPGGLPEIMERQAV